MAKAANKTVKWTGSIKNPHVHRCPECKQKYTHEATRCDAHGMMTRLCPTCRKKRPAKVSEPVEAAATIHEVTVVEEVLAQGGVIEDANAMLAQVLLPVTVADGTCLRPGCGRDIVSRGLCTQDYDIAYFLVHDKHTTWEALVARGKVLAKGLKRPRAEVDKAPIQAWMLDTTVQALPTGVVKLKAVKAPKVPITREQPVAAAAEVPF
jgi:hypothetical protein